MQRRTIQLRVAGQQYKVASTADEKDLQRLADVVDQKVQTMTPQGKMATPQSVLLAAIALANEVEEERASRAKFESQTRDLLRRVLMRIDDVLDDDVDAASAAT